MAHPDRISLAFLPHAFEQRVFFGDLDLGAAELAVVAALDLAAELVRHRLFAVADAEHRQAGLIELGWRQRSISVEHRSRAAGEDHGPGLHRREGFARFLERYDLAIDAVFAHAPGDQLGDLGAEIDDEDFVVHWWWFTDRQ